MRVNGSLSRFPYGAVMGGIREGDRLPSAPKFQVSFDRERGGRARLGHSVGQPRVAGVTVCKAF